MKKSYEYYDILNLGFDEPQEMLVSLSLYSKNKEFVVNPYQIEDDDFGNDVQINTQFNKLLLDLCSSESIIYYCFARDIFSHYDKPDHSYYLSKVYFPFLFRRIL